MRDDEWRTSREWLVREGGGGSALGTSVCILVAIAAIHPEQVNNVFANINEMVQHERARARAIAQQPK